MRSERLNIMLEIALFATISLILDLFIPALGPFKFDFKMVPVIVLALRRGVVPGILGGFLWGLLQFLVGDATILTITQFLLEYFVAFSMIGLAGVVSNPLKDTIRKEPKAYGKQLFLVGSGVIIGSAARYVIHFIAGFVFWGIYAPEGQGAVLYSFIVNGIGFLTEAGTSLVVVFLMVSYFEKLFLGSTSRNENIMTES